MRIVQASPRQLKSFMTYRVCCVKCEAILQYDNSDIDKIGNNYIVKCPTEGCGQYVTHYEDNYVPMGHAEFHSLYNNINWAHLNPEYLEKRSKVIEKEVTEVRSELEAREELDSPKSFVYLP